MSANGEVRLVHAGQHEVGEGPLWHDGIERLFWFSILEGLLLSCDADGGGPREWRLGERASAAGIVGDETLIVATETGLWRFDLASGEKVPLVPLEADNPRTRSNDGRAAPDGSFWIGTMGLNAESEAGAIYRYDAGRVEVIARRVTIPNAICFAPDGRTAYWGDTATRQIMRVPLDETGAPSGDAEVLIDTGAEELNPDGAVTDADGDLWVAQWGASRVSRYGPNGAFKEAVEFPTAQVSCPCFGGPGLSTLFATTAWQDMPEQGRDPKAGNTFAVDVAARGLFSPRVRLG